MVLILSDKENKTDREIAEILAFFDGVVVSNDENFELSPHFNAICRHSVLNISAQKGVVVATDNIEKFRNQQLPSGFIGVCDEKNKNALNLFKKNKLLVITCGTGRKNTLSVSSISDNDMLLCLQRSITDAFGKLTEPCEIKIEMSRHRNLFSLLAAMSVIFYYGNMPKNSKLYI